MNETAALIEEYRKTLVALEALLEHKKLGRAGNKELAMIRSEIDEVTEVLLHLQKGAMRYRWKPP